MSRYSQFLNRIFSTVNVISLNKGIILPNELIYKVDSLSIEVFLQVNRDTDTKILIVCMQHELGSKNVHVSNADMSRE